MNPPRAAALAALLHVDVNEGYSNIVLDQTLKQYQLEPRDSALASAIFYGVLERRITLDYFIGQFSKLPLNKLSPVVLEILRIGVYQIFYMEKIPDSAAVNESVQLAKESHAVKSVSFINAVLRNLLRKKEGIVYPDPQKDPIKALSIQYSFPEWLIRMWEKGYGKGCTENLLKAMSKKPPIYIRVNTVATDREKLIGKLHDRNVKLKSVTGIDCALSLETPGSIEELPGFQEGWFHIQDLASQVCCMQLSPHPCQRVIDVCSAPGGKAFTMAEMMENKGELLAFDLYESKIRLIQKGAERLHLSIIQASVRDASAPSSSLPKADCVLCDVPCSGLGIIRRKPEIRYKMPITLDSLPDLQYLILCKSSDLVKSGGRLVYSTCTLNHKENRAVVQRFLDAHPDFLPGKICLPDSWERGVEEPEHQLTLMPQLYGSDGFFIAVLQKK